jgi:TPR repeat protein
MNMKDIRGETALTLATEKGHERIIDILRSTAQKNNPAHAKDAGAKKKNSADTKDKSYLVPYIKKSEAGDIEGTVFLIVFFMEQKNYEEATKYSEMLLKSKTDINVMTNLGYWYKFGKNGPPNRKKALYYYDMAAKLGSVDGLREAGIICAQDGMYKRAAVYFASAMLKGDVPSLWRLGMVELVGDGVSIDIPAGVAKLRVALENMQEGSESSDIQYALGRIAVLTHNIKDRDGTRIVMMPKKYFVAK